mgnify:CR=1 FL=1
MDGADYFVFFVEQQKEREQRVLLKRVFPYIRDRGRNDREGQIKPVYYLDRKLFKQCVVAPCDVIALEHGVAVFARFTRFTCTAAFITEICAFFYFFVNNQNPLGFVVVVVIIEITCVIFEIYYIIVSVLM